MIKGASDDCPDESEGAFVLTVQHAQRFHVSVRHACPFWGNLSHKDSSVEESALTTKDTHVPVLSIIYENLLSILLL